MVRDMSSARTLLSPEMYATLQHECERLRSERRVNYLDHITIRSVQVTEAWQESGQDFVTVHILASLMDYTIDEDSKQVVEGSRTTQTKFEEYWTFVRLVVLTPGSSAPSSKHARAAHRKAPPAQLAGRHTGKLECLEVVAAAGPPETTAPTHHKYF